jgi:hypothetical protein
MKKLAEKINRNGYIYTQLKRGERAAIYEQIFEDLGESFCIGYEVFKIRIGKSKVVFGVELPEKEKFPSDEDFGKWAWTYRDLNKAMEKYNGIENGLLGDEENDEI